MTYQETLDYLFNCLPVFSREGASAYKPGLATVTRLSEYFGSPHRKLKTIHIAGTNGKGSTAHTLAAILHAQGYKTGLFTSPHILDFRERIRIDGEMIGRDEVVRFTQRYLSSGLEIQPSFFELTTVMAFDYFVKQGVDVAVIEVGLGGRLDSTNIINPILSVITNISLDHTSLLGTTPEAIASEKAGIIKQNVPVVIGESVGGVRKCFEITASNRKAEIVFADDSDEIISADITDEGMLYVTRSFGNITGDLRGNYQKANAATVFEAVKMLRSRCGVEISDLAVAEGFSHAASSTGLTGRWMKISSAPLTVCDTGHNPGGWEYLAPQIAAHNGHKRIVLGFVNDKDVDSIVDLLTEIRDASFYFTSPSPKRALPATDLAEIAAKHGISGSVYGSVTEAYEKALADSIDKSNELIFIGGSTFVVADLLSAISGKQ